jgi:hypothetical protein
VLTELLLTIDPNGTLEVHEDVMVNRSGINVIEAI